MAYDVSAPAVTPRCAAHPEAPADATCQRCGNFVCTACSTPVMSAVYCPACADRPEVNYLEAFRLTLWGRRDSWTYFIGASSLLLAGLGLKVLLELAWYVGAPLLGAAALGVAFFFRMRWARLALILYPVAVGVLLVPVVGPPILLLCGVPFLIALQAFLDPRNRLFFRIQVPERELQKLWDLNVNNPLARHAVSLGVASVFMPLCAPLAVILGLIALRRVDLQARPPIGRRGQALAGIVLGVGAALFWGLVVFPQLRGNFS